MKALYALILMLLFSSLLSCGRKSKSEPDKLSKTEVNDEYLEIMGTKKYSSNFKTIKNSDKTFALLVSERKKGTYQEYPDLVFSIFNLDNQQLVGDYSEINAEVFWKDNTTIVVTKYPDHIPGPDQAPLRPKSYKINAETGKKTK